LPTRGRAGQPLYFEALREASGRLPQGLIRLGPPANDFDVAAAETELGRKFPHSYRELLRSFNGVELFGESIVILGVKGSPFGAVVEANRLPMPENLHAGELVIAGTSEGDLVVVEPSDVGSQGRLHRLRPDAEERWLAGSSLTAWLEATIAHEEILYDRQGEFKLEAFSADGEITPDYALKQAERAVRKDPVSGFAQYELGAALRALGRLDRAREAFARASQLDPTNPWPRFALGRAQHTLGKHGEAALSFEQAANLSPGQAGGRFLAWAVRCLVEQKDRAAAERLRAQAIGRHPTLADELRRAAEAEEAGDAAELAGLLEGDVPLTRRLPVMTPGPRRRD
jgi:tetratricopeptide (TPR) repeat protein